MDDEQKAKVASWAVLGMVFFGGYLIGRSKRSGTKRKVYKPGVYVDGDRTASVLMTVGMNALKDGLYDEYELVDMITESDI